MTQEEVNKAFEELKNEGMDDNALLVALGEMYRKGDITKDQLGGLIYELGYEFTEDFASKPEGEDKEGMFDESEEEPDEPDKGEGGDEPKDEEPKPEDKGEEDDERSKAMRLFGR